jgi:flagellar hook-basal body complex protein FliE
MINFDPNVNSFAVNTRAPLLGAESAGPTKTGFSNAIAAAGQYVSHVDELQQASDASIQDLLTGRNNDITAVVSAVAKADVSFKVLVGVRNKLIEAYKQTMNMPL